MSEYKIAVPSYNRLDLFGETTYKYLLHNNIDPKDIYIFVSREKDLVEYREVFKNVILVPDKYQGIGAVRNYILNIWSQDGEQVVMMDDDIQYIKNISGEMVLEFDEFIIDFFDRLLENALYFGGMCLCSNTFFMDNSYSTNLKYISGAVQFYRVYRDLEVIETPYRHFENMGGLSERLKEAEVNADKIITEFPGWVSKYKKNKSSRNPECCNLRLNCRAKKK